MRWRLVGVHLAVAALLVVGVAALAAAGGTTVRMVYWPGSESDAMQKVVDWWNANRAASEGFRVEMVLFSREGFWERQAAILAARSPEVDLIFTATYIIGRHAPGLLPLEPLFEREGVGELDIFMDVARDSLKIGGQQYAIPLDISVHFLYYRRDLIDRLLTDPGWQKTYTQLATRYLGKALSPKRPETWTWDDFMATSLFFTRSVNPASPTRYGTALQAKNLIYNVMIWNDVLWSLGGRWFDQQGAWALDPAVTRKALDVYIDLMRLGASPATASTYEYPETNEAFRTGSVALILQWSAAYHELTDPQASPLVHDKVGIAPIPGPKPSSHVHSLGVGVNAASRNLSAATRWLGFLASEPAMRMYAQAGGIPPVSSVLLDPQIVARRPEFPLTAQHVERYGFVETTDPEFVPILEVLAKHFSAAWALQKDPDRAIADANQEVRALLAARRR